MRRATVNDIEALEELFVEFALEGLPGTETIPFDAQAAHEGLLSMLQSDAYAFFFEPRKGVVMCMLHSLWYAPQVTYAIADKVYVHPDYRGGFTAARLIKAFEVWAKEVNATHAGIGEAVASTQARRLFERLGYRQFSTQFIKEVT